MVGEREEKSEGKKRKLEEDILTPSHINALMSLSVSTEALSQSGLAGRLQVLQALVSSFSTVCVDVASERLYEFLLDQCLFGVQKDFESRLTPACRSPQAREAAYSLVLALVRGCPGLHSRVLRHQLELLEGTDIPDQWSYDAEEQWRSPSGLLGLVNMGCTCYMNSSLQQLYNNPVVRKVILSAQIPGMPAQQTEDPNAYFFALQKLFAHLHGSDAKAATTAGFCDVYKNIDGTPVNVDEQMDANEFLYNLFKKLDDTLEGTPQGKTLQGEFKFSLMYTNTCAVCTLENLREEPFYSLSVDVKGKKNVEECLRGFFEGEQLDSYVCPLCDHKARALRKTSVLLLPPSLIISLNRFEFNRQKLEKVKLNDAVEFSLTLNMGPYLDDADAAAIDYDLVGILVHMGTSDAGHYYSYVRQVIDSDGQRGDWFEVNDETVRPFDLTRLGEECFGGTETQEQYDKKTGKITRKVVPKTNNAYMLFYERRGEGSNVSRSMPAQPVAVSSHLKHVVWDSNQRLVLINHLFDESYFRFMWDILNCREMVPPSEFDFPPEDGYEESHVSFRLSFQFLIKMISRAKGREGFLSQICELVRVYISRSASGAYFFLQSLDREAISSLLIECPNEDVRSAFLSVVTQAFTCLAPHERPYTNMIKSEDPDKPPSNASMVIKIITDAFSLSFRAASYWRHFSQYFSLFHHFALLGETEREFLLNHHMIAEFLTLFLGDYSFSDPERKYHEIGTKYEIAPVGDLFELISLLVCCGGRIGCKISDDLTVAMPPTQFGRVLSIPEQDLTKVIDQGFLHKALKTNLKATALCRILCQFVYASSMHDLIIQILVDNIETLDEEYYPSFFQAINSILNLQGDGFEAARVNTFMPKFLAVVEKNLKDTSATNSCRRFLLDLSETNRLTREWILSNRSDWQKIVKEWGHSIEDCSTEKPDESSST